MTTEIEISDRDSRTVLAVKSLALQHEVNIATLCRVVSLAVVAGIMSEAIPGTSTDDGGKRIEPFPQCLTRVQAIDKAMCSNVAYLLRIPNFVHSLMRLLEYRDQKSSMRIIRGNRTVTIMATEQVEIGSNTLPDDSDFDYEDEFDINEEASVVVSGDEFLSTLRTVAQLIPEGVQSPPNAISFIQQFIDIRNRQTINLDRGEGPTVSIDVRTRITNPTVNINEVDGAGTRANERNANNTTFEGAQQEIQQIAQGLTQDMPEANASDCLDFSWFIGQPPSKKYWRFDAMQISDAQHQPDYIRDLISRLNITNGAPVFVSTLLNSVLGSSEDILSGTELSEYLIDRMIAWNDSMALRECFFAVRGLGFDLAVSTSSIQSKMNDVFPSKDERWVIFAKSQNQIYTNQQSFISTLVEYEQIIDWRRPAVQKKHRMRQDRQKHN